MLDKIKNCKLFNNLSISEIELLLNCSKSTFKTYDKNQIIFNQGDSPEYLYILVSGSILICKDTKSGDRNIINIFSEVGDIFGEVYIFLRNISYDFYCIVEKDTIVLSMPKEIFWKTCQSNCSYHNTLIKNTLSILAHKTYNFNKKLEVVASGTLRQKITKYLIANGDNNGNVILKMNRVQFANYLGVTRPSLSRELLNMQNDGLIKLSKKIIEINSFEKLEELI